MIAALIQQLGCRLQQHTTLKLLWLRNALFVLDASDPLIVQHKRRDLHHPVNHPARSVPEFIITSPGVRTPDRRTLQELRHAYGYLLRRHSVVAVIGPPTGSVPLSPSAST